jgi:Ca2+-binding EF-hand superfamily protein
MTQHKLLIVAIAGLLTSGFALADHHDGGMHGDEMHEGGMSPMFSQFDTNKDGRISLQEAQEGTARLFKEIDTNNDGFISKEEMQAHHKAMHEKRAEMMREKWKAADKDGDGALSRAEVDAAHMTMLSRNFDKLDKNKDGKLTPDEVRMGMHKYMQH